MKKTILLAFILGLSYAFGGAAQISAKGDSGATFPSIEDSRKNTINKVYKEAMGRGARQSEIDYWLPRSENFSQMILACRKWLYSSDGAQDLRETITRAYFKKNGFNPSNEYIKNAIKGLKAKKAIYKEIYPMIGKVTKID